MLEQAFIELREQWFNEFLARKPPERAWEESKFTESRRGSRNIELKQKFDAQTKAIIKGECYNVAPRCEDDLNVRR